MTEPNVTDQPKSPEPKPMRRKNRFRRKSDRTFLLNDQDFEPDYDE